MDPIYKLKLAMRQYLCKGLRVQSTVIKHAADQALFFSGGTISYNLVGISYEFSSYTSMAGYKTDEVNPGVFVYTTLYQQLSIIFIYLFLAFAFFVSERKEKETERSTPQKTHPILSITEYVCTMFCFVGMECLYPLTLQYPSIVSSWLVTRRFLKGRIWGRSS